MTLPGSVGALERRKVGGTASSPSEAFGFSPWAGRRGRRPSPAVTEDRDPPLRSPRTATLPGSVWRPRIPHWAAGLPPPKWTGPGPTYRRQPAWPAGTQRRRRIADQLQRGLGAHDSFSPLVRDTACSFRHGQVGVRMVGSKLLEPFGIGVPLNSSVHQQDVDSSAIVVAHATVIHQRVFAGSSICTLR